MLIGKITNFKRGLILILSFLFFMTSHSQSEAQNRNYLGFHIFNGMALPYKVEGKSDYAYIKFQPNYQYGFGAQYNFNFKKNYALVLGLDLNFRSMAAKHSTNRFLINKEMFLNDPFPSGFEDNKESLFLLGLEYQSISVPILFKYNIYTKNNIFYSLKTGINIRYYFSSEFTFNSLYFADEANTISIQPIYANFDINGKRSIELDNNTEFSTNFILKNKNILELSFLVNIPFLKVNSAEVIYLKDTPLESKHNVIINDVYFGIKVAYLFKTKVKSSKVKKIKDKNDGYY